MRLLQSHDLVKVASESRISGADGNVRCYAGFSRELQKCERLHGRLKPSVTYSIVFSNSRGGSFGGQSEIPFGSNFGLKHEPATAVGQVSGCIFLARQSKTAKSFTAEAEATQPEESKLLLTNFTFN